MTQRATTGQTRMTSFARRIFVVCIGVCCVMNPNPCRISVIQLKPVSYFSDSNTTSASINLAHKLSEKEQ